MGVSFGEAIDFLVLIDFLELFIARATEPLVWALAEESAMTQSVSLYEKDDHFDLIIINI
jgi:hypothetical protein